MFKKHLKIIFLTLTFSTQLAFNTFSMNVDDDPSRQSISTRQGSRGIINPALQRQMEGQNIQQPFNPSHIPPHPKATKQQHGETPNPQISYDQQTGQILSQQPFNPSAIPPYPAPTRGQIPTIIPISVSEYDYEDEGFFEHYPDTRSKEEKKYGGDVYDFGKENKLYKRDDGSDPRSSDDEDN